jgi:hypothetical protein
MVFGYLYFAIYLHAYVKTIITYIHPVYGTGVQTKDHFIVSLSALTTRPVLLKLFLYVEPLGPPKNLVEPLMSPFYFCRTPMLNNLF